MDPVSLVVAALAAGALQGVGSAAGTAVTDAYQALKDQLRGLLAGRVAGEVALEQHEAAPEVWREPLKAELRSAHVEQDEAVIEPAQRLLKSADPEGARAGKYTVDARAAQGVQIGDRNRQDNVFHAPPTG